MIDNFKGEHAFLSNFYRWNMRAEGRTFPTVEHYFQWQKCVTDDDRARIECAPAPQLAKRRGRQVALRPDWEAVKLGVMLGALRLKFPVGGVLAESLVATHPHALVEGNTWGDRFWGVDGHGLNWLGILLMARRAELMDAQ